MNEELEQRLKNLIESKFDAQIAEEQERIETNTKNLNKLKNGILQLKDIEEQIGYMVNFINSVLENKTPARLLFSSFLGQSENMIGQYEKNLNKTNYRVPEKITVIFMLEYSKSTVQGNNKNNKNNKLQFLAESDNSKLTVRKYRMGKMIESRIIAQINENTINTEIENFLQTNL
jgi:hypothetical protein